MKFMSLGFMAISVIPCWFFLLDIDASLANRLNDRPQVIDEPTNVQQEEYKPVLKCPKCGSDMVFRDKKNDESKFLTCVNYPGCRNAVWPSFGIQTVEVLDQTCETVNWRNFQRSLHFFTLACSSVVLT